LVGQGVELGNAQNELVEFLEKADIPAGRTLLGLSALPSDHPLDIGMLGMHGSYAANMKTQECDVLIAIGMRFSDRVTGLPSTYGKQAKIIHLDIDASEINKNIKADIAVLGNCKQTIPAITSLLNENNHREWRDSFKKYDDEKCRFMQEYIDSYCDRYVFMVGALAKSYINNQPIEGQLLEYYQEFTKIPNTIKELGFDFVKCMDECFLEISSRKQDLDQKLKWEAQGGSLGEKWQKDLNQNPDTLYKADYKKCRIKECCK
jgi:glyoxylate carboligase